MIEVGPFFAIDLDIDKMRVHVGRGILILKTFPLHYMTPVTGRIADADQDGFVFPLRPLKGFITPGIPVNRIVRVLKKIGTAFECETIGHAMNFGY
jgi:hypothetical protein